MRFRRKSDWLLPYISGMSVLDLGCVQHRLEMTTRQHWLHGVICEHAAHVVGVDCLEDEVAALNEEGFHVVCQDVETMELGARFDVVVAGDLIEHLANPGVFLAKVRLHLKEDGLFLLTTPNPFHLFRFIQLLFGGRVTTNVQHKTWFSAMVLEQLAKEYGMEVVDVAYVNDSHDYYPVLSRWGPFLLLSDLLCAVRAEFSETLCFVLKPYGESNKGRSGRDVSIQQASRDRTRT